MKDEQRGAHAERRHGDRGNAALGAQGENGSPHVEHEEIEAVDIEVGAVQEGFDVAVVDAVGETDRMSSSGLMRAPSPP